MRTFLDDNNQKWDINLTWDKAEQIAIRCERPDSTPEERKTLPMKNIGMNLTLNRDRATIETT